MIRNVDCTGMTHSYVNDVLIPVMEKCYQASLDYDRSKQPVSDVIYIDGDPISKRRFDQAMERSIEWLPFDIITREQSVVSRPLTDEEEAAMVDEINNPQIADRENKPSPVFYQHARNRNPESWLDGDPSPLLKGGATIAYDYHTAAEGCVDIAYGYAICADTDYFCKARGRDIALRRLRNLTEMSGCITLPLKPRLSSSDVNDYVTAFMRRLLELLWSQQRG